MFMSTKNSEVTNWRTANEMKGNYETVSRSETLSLNLLLLRNQAIHCLQCTKDCIVKRCMVYAIKMFIKIYVYQVNMYKAYSEKGQQPAKFFLLWARSAFT